MKIGYVRVSKQEQPEALQVDALKEAGCEKWFLDKITGSKTEREANHWNNYTDSTSLKFVFTIRRLPALLPGSSYPACPFPMNRSRPKG
jgi:hypothetical protein